MNQKSLVPPRFAIAASPFLYDPDLPDHLYRTYARIAGLAWQKEAATERTYEKTPPLTVYELAVICNLSVRNTWRHIRDLGQRGLLTWEEKRGVQTRMIFYPVWPGNGVDARDSLDLADDPAGALPASQGAPEPETTNETHQALAEFGVNILEPLARQVAALPHVTPELVRAWGANLLQRPGIHNLPGLLLHILQRHTEPPPEARPAPPVASPGQAGLPQPAAVPAEKALSSSTEKVLDSAEGIEALPAELERALQDLGWSGDDAWREVAGMASHDLDFVWAWVRYVEAHPNLGAGFLRAQLRGSTWPAHKKDARARDRERWRGQWQSQEDEHPLPRSTPSPREQAMARYDISPETMQVWEKVQEELALQMTRATFDTWLSSAWLLRVDDGRATIGVRCAHAVDWLKNRLDGVIKRTLARHLDRPVDELDVVLLQDGGGASA